MKSLLRLYPRRWRERYGGEMGALLEELPAGIGVALDLVGGAVAAYASLLRGNRMLSAAAAFLHGVCVAVLVQAIAFVLLILASQQSQAATIVAFGSVKLASVSARSFFLRSEELSAAALQTISASLPALALLTLLVAVTAAIVLGPRWVRRSQS